MRNITKLFSILFVGALLTNCSGDDKPASTAVPATVVTTSATNTTGLGVTLAGKIIAGSTPIVAYGFCVDTEINPTVNDPQYPADGNPANYSLTIDSPVPNAVLHVRAYGTTIAGVTYYGNDITYSSGFPLTLSVPTDILPKSVLFRGAVLSNPAFVYEMGYCYHTSPNPTISNLTLGVTDVVGTFNNSVGALLPNTNYYARPYCSVDGQTYYGAEVTFKTTGYFGPGGGYVFYDKGDSTDGWRYLEVHPQVVPYNTSSSCYWGCNAVFMSNTYPEIGKGLANTTHISNTCPAANCAAWLCESLVRGGQSDWFLGSRDEMYTAATALRSINVMLNNIWTSTEIDSDEVYEITYYPSYHEVNTTYKTSNNNAYPIRRF